MRIDKPQSKKNHILLKIFKKRLFPFFWARLHMSLLLPMNHYPLHYMKRVGETDKLRGSNEFNKCNNTGARMQDSILYHMTLKSHFICNFSTERFRH